MNIIIIIRKEKKLRKLFLLYYFSYTISLHIFYTRSDKPCRDNTKFKECERFFFFIYVIV